MTTLHHVKKARKTIRGTGVKKGDSYYWWSFRVGGRGSVKQVSKTRPRRSQLTRSPFLQAMYEAEDSLAAAVKTFAEDGDLETLIVALYLAAEAVREVGRECGEKRDNLPENLKDSPTGELLQERQEACERIADELESLKDAVENNEDASEDWKDLPGIVADVDWSHS